MSTINQVQLVAPSQMASADSVIYTTPALTVAKIGRAVFCNTDSAPHTITVNITTGASGPGNELIAARVVSPGETYVSPELAGAVIPSGQSVRGFCSAAAVITLTISGITVTGQ